MAAVRSLAFDDPHWFSASHRGRPSLLVARILPSACVGCDALPHYSGRHPGASIWADAPRTQRLFEIRTPDLNPESRRRSSRGRVRACGRIAGPVRLPSRPCWSWRGPRAGAIAAPWPAAVNPGAPSTTRPLSSYQRRRPGGRVTAPVAQLDRASVYGTEGREFESLRARFQSPGHPGLLLLSGSTPECRQRLRATAPDNKGTARRRSALRAPRRARSLPGASGCATRAACLGRLLGVHSPHLWG